MTDRPTGILTFLFTDIQGSTSRWEEQESEMRAALARHDQVLRAAIESRGGWLFKHTGDGVLAAFASPSAAAEAAIDAQRALDLPVRMGLATGEAELRDDDYFGPTLNRAARVMAAGHGGQVLVSSSTSILLDGFDLVDLGEHRLKDLSRPQRLFQLSAAGLEKSFPPLRTLDAAAGNLPLQSTSFIGRENEVASVIEALRLHRLVTLTGVGGVGKTRLALQVAAELASRYQGGAWLVELAPIGDAAATAHAIAATFGIGPQPGKTIAESLIEGLGGRQILLVLDNCEHLIDAVAELAERIVRACAGVTLLATSREALRIEGEQSWPVPSLGFREGALSPAVRLFDERARSVVPSFELAADAEAANRYLPPTRRHPAGHRAGRGASALDEPGADPRQARRALPLAHRRIAPGAGATPDAAPRGAMVLRPLGRARAGSAPAGFGLRRRLHLRGGGGDLPRR